MEKRKLIWIGLTFGTLLGSMVGDYMSDSMFSISGVFWSTMLGAFGVYLGYKYGE